MNRGTKIVAGVLALVLVPTAYVAGQSGSDPTPMADGAYDCDFESDGFICTPEEVATTTTVAATTTTAATTSTSTPPAPTTTVVPTTTTIPATTTTVASTTTQAPTTTAATTTTTTTPPPPGLMFSAQFATEADFYDRFWTYTGNYCTPNHQCRPEMLPDGLPFTGSHNMACNAPPTSRTVTLENHRNFFWWCAPGGAATGHVMTGLMIGGYSLVNFTPQQFFTNVNKVCWDMSLADLGGGKWANVQLVPRAKVESHPNLDDLDGQEGEGPWRLDYVIPDFDRPGNPGEANLQDIANIVGVQQFRGSAAIWNGRNPVADPNHPGSPDFVNLVQDFSSIWTNGTNESQRFRHCFEDLGNGTMRYTQNRGAAGTYTLDAPGAFPNGEVAVIFQDDSYNPEKHGGTALTTWHWDNIEIS